MKILRLLSRVSLCVVISGVFFTVSAQTPEEAFPSDIGTTTSHLSPLHHLLGLTKGGAPRPQEHNICAPYVYYNDLGANITYSETVPTSLWAIRISPLSTAATVCTVWTINTNFEITNTSPGEKDTIQIVIKDGTPPYNQLFSTWFLARSGDNLGDIEIDPPSVAPFTRPIIYPKRDIYVGFYIRGQYPHNVNFRFKTPQQYTNPMRSVKFTSTGSFVSAAAATSQNVEWFFSANLCCDYVVPVELSAFSGVYNGRSVDLVWKTESETSNAGFQIQRSRSSAGPWTTIGVVAGSGTTTQPQNYSFRDSEPFLNNEARPPVLWYRLVQTDYDGTVNELPAIRVAIAPLESTQFALFAGYPNPVALQSNGAVTIPYQVQKDAALRLTVVDALGREVAVLYNGMIPAGYYESLWYPRSSPYTVRSGNYFIHLKAAEFSSIRKIAVIE